MKKALAAAQKTVVDELAQVENRARGVRSTIKTDGADVIAAMEKNLHEFDEMMNHARTRMTELITATKAKFEALDNAASGMVALLEATDEKEPEGDPAFAEQKTVPQGSKNAKKPLSVVG
jgi:hypothetical protein